jgi:hypothetical protein
MVDVVMWIIISWAWWLFPALALSIFEGISSIFGEGLDGKPGPPPRIPLRRS